ncbi:MAG: prenyltransferase/squalene oxidase repeat-containing protein [Candidatus Heimdallarchaeaceae archaeon]
MKEQSLFTILSVFLMLTCITTSFVVYAADQTNETENGVKTRLDLLKDYLKSVSSDNGFAEKPNDGETIEATFYGIQLADYLKIEYDIYDLTYFIQKLQRDNYGFANKETEDTSLNATYFAVQALIQLGIDSESLDSWKIYEYINSSISPILYNPSNYSILQASDIQAIYRFFLTASALNRTVIFAYNALLNSLKNFQYTNGTYPNFDLAIQSILLLKILDKQPTDTTGALRYLKAFRFNETGFAKDLSDNITIRDTFWAISAITQLSGTIENRQKLIDAVLDLQTASGGFQDSKDNDEVTLRSTYYAYLILQQLDGLEKLNQLAFLASTGFLTNQNMIAITIILPFLAVIKVLKSKKINSKLFPED